MDNKNTNNIIKNKVKINSPIFKRCLYCNKKFRTYISRLKSGRGKYCSRKCYELSKRKRIKKTCEICGKVFYIPPSKVKQNRGKYCSNKCQGIGFKGEKSPLWNGGVSFGKYCPKWTENLREGIRNLFGRKCQICGLDESKNYGRKLSVHHVTYDKNACCNNKIAMFVPLCTSCHTKTTHNREYWENILFSYLNIYFDGKTYPNQKNTVYYRGVKK